MSALVIVDNVCLVECLVLPCFVSVVDPAPVDVIALCVDIIFLLAPDLLFEADSVVVSTSGIITGVVNTTSAHVIQHTLATVGL